jgi:hypothetical protein
VLACSDYVVAVSVFVEPSRADEVAKWLRFTKRPQWRQGVGPDTSSSGGIESPLGFCYIVPVQQDCAEPNGSKLQSRACGREVAQSHRNLFNLCFSFIRWWYRGPDRRPLYRIWKEYDNWSLAFKRWAVRSNIFSNSKGFWITAMSCAVSESRMTLSKCSCSLRDRLRKWSGCYRLRETFHEEGMHEHTRLVQTC